MPLPLTVSCFSKIQIGFTFLVPVHPGSPGQRAIIRVCVCVYGVGLSFIEMTLCMWGQLLALVDSCTPEVWAGCAETAAVVTAAVECPSRTTTTSKHTGAATSGFRWPAFWQAVLYGAAETCWKDHCYVCCVLSIEFTKHISGERNAVSCVCLPISTVAFEPTDFWSWFFVCVYAIDCRKVTVIGQDRGLWLVLARMVKWSVCDVCSWLRAVCFLITALFFGVCVCVCVCVSQEVL